MTELITCLSGKKENWNYVIKLIEDNNWDKIIIVADDFGEKNFKVNKKIELIIVDSNKPLVELAKDIREKLTGKINGIEVVVNFVSGNGKEHMALMGALLKLGIGVRFVALTPAGIEQI